jgi:hypothetical protein
MRRQSCCRSGGVDGRKLEKECGELDKRSIEKNDERLYGFGKRACWL